MRQKAQTEGNLKSTPEQTVIVQQNPEIIVIEAANPEVVYVPVYNLMVVYGTWWYPSYPRLLLSAQLTTHQRHLLLLPELPSVPLGVMLGEIAIGMAGMSMLILTATPILTVYLLLNMPINIIGMVSQAKVNLSMIPLIVKVFLIEIRALHKNIIGY